LALIDDVKIICNRLASKGWKELFSAHGLDITSTNLENEFDKELNINRNITGFEDFALEGKRAIEPNNPARSLLFHAFASPNVVKNVTGSNLTDFPTLAEIEIIENYVYGKRPPSLTELKNRAGDDFVAIVVFAYEYRPAPETVHRKHADMCFSRTGVTRVGTNEVLYNPKERGFLPFVEGNEHGFRVLPAKYAAFIAVERKGDQNSFGPMRFRNSDQELDFWVPLHKLFNGSECIRDQNLTVTLDANHVNEKLKRIHLELSGTGWSEPDISNSPFIFHEGIAEWSQKSEFGEGLLVPVMHSNLVEPAEYKGKPLTFVVPKNNEPFASSFEIEAEADDQGNPTWRHAPEYVHVRHRMRTGGTIENLNESRNVRERVGRGGYRARHYIDFTGDGWIKANCPQIAIEIPRNIAAYSLVTAPDFFPNCDQRELMDWWEQKVPQFMRNLIWRIPPETLSDGRIPPNLTLDGAGFRAEDKTATAIVSQAVEGQIQTTVLDAALTTRQTWLPDSASNVFQPGWDIAVSRRRDGDRSEFLAAYGLGSPFLEDAKLCAALSAFWPGVTPDAARTFEPNNAWPTIAPLTDEEIGQESNLPWDGVSGPEIIRVGSKDVVEYSEINHVDYVDNALQNKFSLTLTGKIDTDEYKTRVLSMARVYITLGAIDQGRGLWGVISFKKVPKNDNELQQAEVQSGESLQGTVYRFVLFRHGQTTTSPNNFKKKRVSIRETATLFADPIKILVKRNNDPWQVNFG